MRWHHYAGLAFGATTFTWIFSGLLSMDPWDWHPGTAPAQAQREAVAGGPLSLTSLTVARLRRALAEAAPEGGRDVELIQFRGEPFIAIDGRLVALNRSDRGAFARFESDAVEAAARAAMPGVPLADATWLDRYDSYYYDRGATLPLPVLRARFADANATWLYLDPARGAIVRKEERLSRVNRWIYHGFHSFDFPALYARRPLWDVFVIALSLGGLASAVTSVLPAWRRLAALFRGRRAPSSLQP
jgi:hypothetical protein